MGIYTCTRVYTMNNKIIGLKYIDFRGERKNGGYESRATFINRYYSKHYDEEYANIKLSKHNDIDVINVASNVEKVELPKVYVDFAIDDLGRNTLDTVWKYVNTKYKILATYNSLKTTHTVYFTRDKGYNTVKDFVARQINYRVYPVENTSYYGLLLDDTYAQNYIEIFEKNKGYIPTQYVAYPFRYTEDLECADFEEKKSKYENLSLTLEEIKQELNNSNREQEWLECSICNSRIHVGFITQLRSAKKMEFVECPLCHMGQLGNREQILQFNEINTQINDLDKIVNNYNLKCRLAKTASRTTRWGVCVGRLKFSSK